MGFFSSNCYRCADSIIAPYDIPPGLEWQNKAVVITPNSSILRGTYDGYGRLECGSLTVDEAIGHGTNTVYHEACWVADGSPATYAGPSDPADDQGFFYERTTGSSTPPSSNVTP